MKPNTFMGSSTTKSGMTYLPGGTKYGPYTAVTDFPAQVGSQFKNSIDTGKFVKGVYRVNPYSVGCQQFVHEDVLNISANWISGDYRVWATVVGRLMTDALFLNSRYFADDYGDLRSRVITQAYAKLGRSRLELGVELGELKETLGMILNPLGSARRYLAKNAESGYRRLAAIIEWRRTRKFRNLKGPSAKKAAEDTWMELRYGLRPFLDSIKSIMDYLEEEAKKPNGIQSVRSHLRNFSGKRTVTSTKITDGGNYFAIPLTTIVEDTVDALGIVHFNQVKPWSQLTKLGLSKRYLPEIMWELTSRSFVWDWFLGIGQTIALFRENPEIVVLGGCGSIKVTRTVTCRTGPTAYLWSQPSVTAKCGGTGMAKYTKFQRVGGLTPSYIPIFYGGSKIDLAKVVDMIIMGQQSILKNTHKHMR